MNCAFGSAYLRGEAMREMPADSHRNERLSIMQKLRHGQLLSDEQMDLVENALRAQDSIEV